MVQVVWKRTIVGFYNLRKAGSDEIIATVSPAEMTSLLGYKPAGLMGCAELNMVKAAS